MEKKFKFTDKANMSKILYAVVIALLCITAVVVGLVAANNRKQPTPTPDDNPGVGDNSGDNNTPVKPDEGDGEGTKPDANPDDEKKGFIAPTVGKLYKEHNLSLPVFSETLEEWRVHTGIDISTEEGADVFAVSDGEVIAVYSHPLNGFTVEVKHSDTLVSVYSNLDSKSSATPKVGDTVKTGDKIGNVGDSSISELAEEAHLHFEIKLSGAKVNPLDYISDEAKRASLGMDIEAEGEKA